MAKRLTISQTPAEAERFLWHVIDHMRERPQDDNLTVLEDSASFDHAVRVIRMLIRTIQAQQ